MRPYIVLGILWGIIVFLLFCLLLNQIRHNRQITDINTNLETIAKQLKIDNITIYEENNN